MTKNSNKCTSTGKLGEDVPPQKTETNTLRVHHLDLVKQKSKHLPKNRNKGSLFSNNDA